MKTKGKEMTRESVKAILDPMVELLVKKNQDYHGASFDLGITGNLVHIWDKVSRLKNMIENAKNGKQPNFESIEDTYRDLIGYCVIGLHILEGEKNHGEVSVDEFKKNLYDKYPTVSHALIDNIVDETVKVM